MSSTWSSVLARAALVALSGPLAACQSDPMAPKTVQSAPTAALKPQARRCRGQHQRRGGPEAGLLRWRAVHRQHEGAAGDASAATIANNGSINQIYASNDLDEEQDFISVIDAIQGDGFNPLWHQNLIVFNPGFTPHQFTSDEEVLAAAAGPEPRDHVVSTDEVYRCSVAGHTSRSRIRCQKQERGA